MNRVPLGGQKKGPLPSERIASSFKQLAVSSAELNSAVGELAVNISPLDKALAKLELGVSACHKIAGYDEGFGSFWSRDIGYSKVGKRWGIALRKASGHHEADRYEEEVWLFSDAPRWMQIESVGKIPDLFDELIKRTEDTIKKIRAKTIEARDLAIAINEAISALSPLEK
jgi:hypothetical protein